MEFKTWVSFSEEIPKAGSGLLIKIIPKGDDEWNVIGKLYYGYIYPYLEIIPNQDGLLLLVAELDGQELFEMHWKAWKEFDHDELFWLYQDILSRKGSK